MTTGAEPPHEAMRDAIRRYLYAHPDAADTLVGIRQWWLPDRLRSADIDTIRSVLHDLVARGEMRRDVLPDGTWLFARAAPGGLS